MSIVRRHHNGNFTIVPNAIFNDKRLSVEAKGTLGWLLSRPHDWMIKLANIGPTLRIGRHQIGRIFKELIDAGYIKRNGQTRTATGWGHADYVVFDEPNEQQEVPEDVQVENLHAENLHAENLHAGDLRAENQPTYKELKDNKTESNQELILTKTKSCWPADYAEQFWEAYPNKVGRKDALQKLSRVARSGEVSFAEVMTALKRAQALRQ